LGPFRFTNTKQNLSPVLGLEGYRNIIELMKSKNIEIPVYAIGGIIESDVKDLALSGVFGIAVSGMFSNKNNIKELIERLNIILNNHVNNSR
ncbi:MAG: thiamine phosphate synthase, partial [Bacteroidota bacterium]|nr:thiamine phosphate synthase [Bacteroidota bacterium]